MNKSELIARIAERTDVKKSDVSRVVDALFDTQEGAICESLREGNNVAITGFGNFGVTERAARKGRNPQTGKAIDIPASRAPSFKAGKGFKDALKR